MYSTRFQRVPIPKSPSHQAWFVFILSQPIPILSLYSKMHAGKWAHTFYSASENKSHKTMNLLHSSASIIFFFFFCCCCCCSFTPRIQLTNICIAFVYILRAVFCVSFFSSSSSSLLHFWSFVHLILASLGILFHIFLTLTSTIHSFSVYVYCFRIFFLLLLFVILHFKVVLCVLASFHNPQRIPRMNTISEFLNKKKITK